MKRYKLRAIYKVTKELTVTVPDGVDPHDESQWLEIEQEHEVDFSLYDVEADSAEEV